MKTKAKNKYKVSKNAGKQPPQKDLKSQLPPLAASTLSQFEDAVRRRDLQTLVWLIDSGVLDVNQETIAGETALTAAVAANNVLAMELLFTRGANPNAINCHGYTPLMKAATVVDADCSEAVLALLRQHADVFARDRSGKTALEWARVTNNTVVCRHLELAIQTHIYARRCAEADDYRVKKYADVLEKHTQLCAAMQAAVASNNFAQVHVLVNSNDINVELFREAAAPGTRFFLDVESSAGWSALTKAASVGDLTTVELLADHGAAINLETKLRHTALTWAAYCGHKEVVQFLLQNHRADWRQPTREGKTALMHACRNGQDVVVQILLSVMHESSVANAAKKDYSDDGAKAPEWHSVFLDALHATDQAGMDAMEYAKTEGHHGTVALLERAKANAVDHFDHVERLKAKTSDVPCKLECGFHHAKDLIGFHEENKCPRRLVECEACKTVVVSMNLEEHQRRICPGRQVTCVQLQYGCPVQLPWNEMQLHQVDHCQYRKVACRLECGNDTLRWNTRDAHEAHDCPLRSVRCPACLADMLGRDLRAHHRSHCPKRIVSCALSGGCGERHPFDETAFHIECLCQLRPRPCRWAAHGCDAVLGPPEVRLVHESTTCDFRLVKCRNQCAVGSFIWCFAAQHYSWDCPNEAKPCPLGCPDTMASQYVHGHQEPNCGFCPERQSRCNLDLCGKKILLFGKSNAAVTARSHEVAAASTGAALTLEGVNLRIRRLQVYLADELDATAPPLARPFLRQWLTNRLTEMTQTLAKLHVESTQLGLVLRYDPTTECHLISVHGVGTWTNLNHTYFAEDPSEHDWKCGWLTAKCRQDHQDTSCPHKIVPCPLGCGQLCQQYQLSSHTKDRCFKRTLACRLGCGLSMSVEGLLAHEESECPLSHQFCPHCHESLLKKNVDNHIVLKCTKYPRPCRLTCGANMCSTDFVLHETTECPKRLVHCSDCDKVVFFQELASHTAEDCPYRPSGLCKLGCGEALRVNQVQLHITTACPQRCVSCPQCNSPAVRVAEFDHHVKFMCPERLLFCQKGCGAKLRESELDAHEALDCLHRPATCPLRCNYNCAASTLVKHMQTECPRRLVRCPNRCPMQVPAIELTTHLRNCDHRMVCCGAGSALCARPLKAWIKHSSLDRCFAHHEHGFMWAVKSSDMDTILTFLHRIHPSALDEEFDTGFTPLVLACSKGDVALVRVLLLHGADVNLETSRGRTPLSEACLGKHLDVVEVLLSHRAVVMHTNRHGLSTMSMAQQMRHDGILALLEKRHQLEQTQRRLFLAIATSDYAAIETIVAGGEMAYRENHAWHLSRELAASAAALDDVRAALTDHMNAMNVSIADSEAKQMKVVKILDSVEYNKAQLEHVQKKEAKVEALRQVTELTVKNAIQAITAQDIVGLISQTEPPPGLLVVLKAMALFNGVIPRVKRGTDVNGFSEKEWWETSQAMLMDRQFLRKLVNFRELDVPPDVLFKVRRECLKHEDFPQVVEFAPSVLAPSDGAVNPPLQAKAKTLPVRRKNAMTPYMALSTWVKGVEINQKSKADAKILSERKAAVQDDLATLDAELKNATFDMKTAHRSLPSRQEELDRIVALESKASADFKLKQRRVDVCELLAFTSLNGHTPLTFAASIGNERAVRLLLNRGANGSYSDEEQRLAAKILQNALRHYVNHLTLSGELATLSSIAGFMSLKPLTKQLKRYRQCNRVALHEAVYNGHHEVLGLLVDAGHAKVWQSSFVEPIAACPGQIEWKQPRNIGFGMGVWKLHFRATPLKLADSLGLGETRMQRTAFREKIGWDKARTIYDDTRKELDGIVAAATKVQDTKRQEQLSRKTILRRAANQRQLHRQLEVAIQAKAYTEAYALLDEGAFPEHATAGGLTVLSQACTEEVYIANADGDIVLVVDYFLDRAAGRPSPNHESQSEDGQSFLPLLVAAHYGTVRCGRSLVSRGGDVNARTTTTGTSALMTAVRNNKDDFVVFLLAHGANVHVKDINGHTALTFAVANNNEKVRALLSQAAADVRQTLLVDGKSTEFGLCRWGCGFVGLFDEPVIENGHIVRLLHPLDAHERSVCPKRVVPCPQNCGVVDLWNEEVSAHVATDCPMRVVACSHAKCTERLPFQHLHRHETSECPHRSVACLLCGESSLAHKLAKHEAAHCRLRAVACPACHDSLAYMDLSRHAKFDCPYRQVRCRLGCGFVESRVRTHHEVTECVKRSIPCIFECEQGTTPEDQAAHELDCDRRLVACANRCPRPADAPPLRACDVPSHLLECPHRFLPCELGCGKKIRSIDMSAHVAATCVRRVVQCAKCAKEMTADELEHRHPDCSARILPCGACGVGGIVADNMARHKADECKMRLVKCKYERDGCMKQPLFAHEKAVHETMECRYRVIWCPLGCGLHLVAKTLKTHEADCAMRFATCSQGCGLDMRERDRLDHEQFDCLYRHK